MPEPAMTIVVEVKVSLCLGGNAFVFGLQSSKKMFVILKISGFEK
jgi:hypothetical protein